MADKPGPDHVDRSRAQWLAQRPDIDTAPMAILGRINRIALAIAPAISASMARYDLDRGEFDVLAALRRAGPPFRLTPTDLYASLMLSSGGLSNRLRRMERKGLVDRLENVVDGRSRLVAMSEKGLNLVDRAFEADMALESSMLEALDDAQRKQIELLLRKLNRSLEASNQER